MSELPLINNNDAEYSKQILSAFYENQMIPAEKKTYLSNLRESVGPYLAIDGSDGKPHYFMDAASQIATLGLGFNSNVFHGASHFLETWTNNPEGREFRKLHEAFRNFFKRKLNWEDIHLTYCNSGAEANEIALGYCFKKRLNLGARKVLAFEGSFHGRLMVSLASTWNKSKREPFEWKGFETEYCPVPDDVEGMINREAPMDWAKVWDQSPSANFMTPSNWSSDPHLKEEIKCLMEVRQKLMTNSIFAVIIEPMQCEGGDRYLTGRFHSALALMAKSFNIPLIHDEVQTGFHLGREFFWHKQLKLRGVNGEKLVPDYVVCAKKAQVGLVISHENPSVEMEFNVGSAIRGYMHAIALDQGQGKIISLEKQASEKLLHLTSQFSEYIENPRFNGLAFSFDFKDKKLVDQFIAERFNYGLLFYPAGERTLRFRLNLGFQDKDLLFLFDQLTNLANKIFLGRETTCPTTILTGDRLTSKVYDWQEEMITTKLHQLQGLDNSSEEWSHLKEVFKSDFDCDLVRIDRSNFDQFANKIIQLQKVVYEPARQTTIDTFKKNAEYKGSVCLALVKNDDLMGIAFSAPLKANPLERGVRKDPYYENENVLYMIDTTIAPGFQGKGQGRFLKYALQIMATAEGKARIQGRNRDRLAAGMLFINLSMGAYEQNYLAEDYPDFEKYRDVFYYTSPLQWENEPLNLCSAFHGPNGQEGLNKSFICQELPYLNNKICLSNFVSKRFLGQVRDLFNLMPENLQHGYTASGQSECVDKLAKTLWYTNKEKKGNRMLSFKGHSFGYGSFLSRSLSSDQDVFFQVDHMDHPHQRNFHDLLGKIEIELQAGDVLAVWIEPLLQKTMQRVPFEFLKGLRVLCKKYETNLVYNETASGFYRYDSNVFFASNIQELTPDASMVYMGGQAAMVFVEQQKFLEKPLMMISTWDGDEFSLSKYHKAALAALNNKEKVMKDYHAFEISLGKKLKEYLLKDFEVKNGCGSFSGKIPHSISKHFKIRNGRYLVYPNLDDIEQFLKKGFQA